jgi:hypothetical protein
MFRSLLLSVAVVSLVLFTGGRAAAQANYPHLHHALFEMREAHKELKNAGHNFGGHREKALAALDAAMIEVEKGLAAVGSPYKGFTPGKLYGSYKNHPHLRHCLVELRAAHTELREAKGNFGGHRDRALRDLNYAIEQVELCIAHIK